jgi:hypothetical protein
MLADYYVSFDSEKSWSARGRVVIGGTRGYLEVALARKVVPPLTLALENVDEAVPTGSKGNSSAARKIESQPLEPVGVGRDELEADANFERRPARWKEN